MIARIPPATMPWVAHRDLGKEDQRGSSPQVLHGGGMPVLGRYTAATILTSHKRNGKSWATDYSY